MGQDLSWEGRRVRFTYVTAPIKLKILLHLLYIKSLIAKPGGFRLA